MGLLGKSEKKMLSRDEILNAKDLKTEIVDCPEWGGSVKVRGLTGGERDKWEASLYTTKTHGRKVEVVSNKDNIRAKLIQMTVVDDDGKLMFSPGDIETLSKKSAAPVDRIFSVAQRLSGIGADDIEELEKNLMSGPEDTSISN